MTNILLAVVGLSPQVITETLFALHQQQKSVDAVHLITTRQGKERINAHLLSPTDGNYHRYLREYAIDPASIDFGFHTIHTIRNEHGVEIDDIEGEQENEQLLKTCLELTFSLTSDPDTAVFFSIAGGRKTMSASLMVAAQFYGRPQDRVYHVLVTPEFENNPDFYYPPRQSATIELKDNKGHPFLKETRYAQITLVPIPFVSVRNLLSREDLRQPRDPATLMLSVVKEAPPALTVDLRQRKLVYKNKEMDMMPAHLALYAFFAQQKASCPRQVSACLGCIDCYFDVQEILSRHEKIAAHYQKLAGTRPLDEMSPSGITSLDKPNFRSLRSKINDALKKSFGLYGAGEIAIEAVGKKPDTRYGIPIEKDRIRVIT